MIGPSSLPPSGYGASSSSATSSIGSRAAGLDGRQIALRLLQRAGPDGPATVGQAGSDTTEALSGKMGTFVRKADDAEMDVDSPEYRDKLQRIYASDKAQLLRDWTEQFNLNPTNAAKLREALQAQVAHYNAAVPQPVESFGQDGDWMRRLGASHAIAEAPLTLDQGFFDEVVVPRIIAMNMENPGFAAAHAAGEVIIRRAEDMPEYNAGHATGYLLYQGNSLYGSAGGSGAFNTDLQHQRWDEGRYVTFAGVMGQNAYLEWPMHYNQTAQLSAYV